MVCFARAVAFASAVVSLGAWAQSTAIPSVEAERLQLNWNGRGSSFFLTGKLLAPGQYNLGVVVAYQRDTLSSEIEDDAVGRVLRHRTTLHLGGAYAFNEWLEVQAQLPVVLWQKGDNLQGFGIPEPASSAIGTPQLLGRVGILSQARGGPLDLSFDMGFGLPIGTKDGFTRDPGMQYSPRLSAGIDAGMVRIGAEAGALFRNRVALSPVAFNVDDEVGDELRGGLSVSTVNDGFNGELAVRGSLSLENSPHGAEILAAGKHPIGDSMQGFVLAALGFGKQPTTPLFRAALGIHFGSPAKPKEEPPPPQPEPTPAPEPPPPPPPAPKVEAPPPPSTPETPRVEVRKEKLVLSQKIQFAYNSSKVSPDSYSLLDEVAQALQNHPEVAHVRIEGHTDNKGPKSVNERLSTERANAVRAYLLGKGISPERLKAQGFGSSKPLVSNDTQEGRDTNRRVELIIDSGSDSSPGIQ